jgi:uncharacterized protein
METKSSQQVTLNIKSLDDKGYFIGYASIFNVLDNHNDIVVPGAFAASLDKWERQGKYPKMLWQHNQKEPIGAWYFMEEDSKGLYVEGQLLMDIQQAREAYSLMRAGAVDGLSIGYKVIKADRDTKSHVRIIKEVDLIEISVVTFAANTHAKITRVKEV